MMRSQRIESKSIGIRAAALVMMVLVLMLQIVAANARLHEKIHHNCGKDVCAVELWLATGGGGEAPEPVVAPELVSQPPLPCAEECLEQVADFVPAHLIGGVRAHSPPRAPSA